MGQRSQAEQKRRVKKIGKVLGGQKDGVICFNGGFLQERPEFRNFLVERKGEEYICTPLNESGTTLTQLQEVKQLHAGATWALDQLVAQSPVGEALKCFFSTTDGLPQDFIYCLFHNSQPGQQHFQVRGVCLGNAPALGRSSVAFLNQPDL